MQSKTLYALAGAIFVLGIIVFLTLTSAPSGKNSQEFSGPIQSLKVAVVTDASFSDKGWGTSSFNAAKHLEQKYGFKVAMEDNVSIADIDDTLNKYASYGYNLIIAHGVQWGDPAVRVAKQYPNVKFVVFTGLVKSDNVASIFPMQQDGSFLLGALAGMMTRTNTIGYIGGEEYPNVINIFAGYTQGAKAVNPHVRVIGTYLNDWHNPPKGKEAAYSIIRQNADIVFHVADSSGQGVIQAAKENGVYAFGAVQDQNALAPSVVLSSFVLDVDKAYDRAVQMVITNDFRGEIQKPGIESTKGNQGDGIVYLAPFHSLNGTVPDQVKVRLSEYTNEMLNGTLVIAERLTLNQT
jgi:basic membrane protein A and related proteins